MFDFIDVSILNKTLQITILNGFWGWFFIILTPLVSLLVAFIAVFKEDIISWRKGPKIYIEYKPETQCKRIMFYNTIPSCWYYFQISNKKIRPCKECIVELSEIYRKTSKGYEKNDFIIPITLKWFNTEDDNTTIYMHQRRYVSLGFILEEGWADYQSKFIGENVFHIEHMDTPKDNNVYWFYPKGNIKMYKPEMTLKDNLGIYRILIILYGSNTKPVPTWWEIEWKGTVEQNIFDKSDNFIITKSGEPKPSEIVRKNNCNSTERE